MEERCIARQRAPHSGVSASVCWKSFPSFAEKDGMGELPTLWRMKPEDTGRLIAKPRSIVLSTVPRRLAKVSAPSSITFDQSRPVGQAVTAAAKGSLTQNFCRCQCPRTNLAPNPRPQLGQRWQGPGGELHRYSG